MTPSPTRISRLRFFRTPKGLLLLVLAALIVVGALHEDIWRVAPGLAGAIVAAAFIDALLLRRRAGDWVVPDGAILTALIIVMVLSPRLPWYVPTITTVVAIASKSLFRIGTANVFNPAALALIATFYPFNTAQNWWGALPESGPLGLLALFATGTYIVVRVNKLPLVLSFLGSYFALFTISAYVGDASRVAEIFRAPDVNATLFFAFFMLSDPDISYRLGLLSVHDLANDGPIPVGPGHNFVRLAFGQE